MLKIVEKYIPLVDSLTGGLVDFEYVHSHYSTFPKISFDYEVAEKAESVAVVPFNGEWKDLGTRNTLTDELHKPVIGNGVMGTLCENTHVINELQNPISAEVGSNLKFLIVCDMRLNIR